MKFITIILLSVFLNACGGSKEAATTAADAETKTEVKTEIGSETKTVSSVPKDNTGMQSKDMIIEYIEQTRGFYRMIKINPKTISSKLKHDGQIQTKSCDQSLWTDLMKEVEAINLKEVSKLEAPSTTHRFDAKPMANLNITKGGETYSTVTFDAGNPHEKLSGLVNRVLSAVEKKD